MDNKWVVMVNCSWIERYALNSNIPKPIALDLFLRIKKR